MCWKLPSTFRLWRLALASTQVAATLTTMPAKAIARISLASTVGGASRLDDDYGGQDEQGQAVALCAEDLGTFEAERGRTPGRSKCEPRRP